MRVGIVKSFAALLVGSTVAMAQPPAVGGGAPPIQGPTSALPARTDVSYPQTSTQLGYGGPLPAETPGGLAVPDHGFGGTSFNGGGPPPIRYYANFECLLWNIRDASLPSLVSNVPVGVINVVSTDTFISPNGTSTTSIQNNLIPLTLLNNPTVPHQNSIDLGEHKGGRLTFGWWFDDDLDCGIEASAFILEKRSQNFRNTSVNTSNQLTLDTGVNDRTFVLPADGNTPTLTSSTPIAFPAQAQAELRGTIWTEFMGAELNVRTSGYEYGILTFGSLMGARYLQFEEGLSVNNQVTLSQLQVTRGVGTNGDVGVVRSAPFLPITFSTNDDIRTHNYIIAPQVGLKAEAYYWGFFFNAQGKVALGANIQEIETIGITTQTSSNFVLNNAMGGLLSGPSDQNDLTRVRISIIPEINLKLGYDCGERFRFWIGYDALYMQHVIRPGEQTSYTTLNTNVSVGDNEGLLTVTQPTIRFSDLDVWVQGINFGVELHY